MTKYCSYDANGKQTNFTDNLNQTTTHFFGALNRQVRTL